MINEPKRTDDGQPADMRGESVSDFEQSPKKSTLAELGLVNILKIAAYCVSFLCVINLALARLGVYGAALKDYNLPRGSARTAVDISLALLGAALVLGLIMIVSGIKKTKSLRSDTVEAVENVIAGGYKRESIAVTDPDDDVIYDRLATVALMMDEMGEEQERLGTERSRAEKERDKLSFNLLTAKAAPAMVKRVMSSVSRLAADGRSEEIGLLTERASRVIESVLSDNRQPVSLASELSLVKTYLEMDELLSGEEIVLRMSILCNIVEYSLIPNLILPVVANYLDYARKGNKLGRYEISMEVATAKNRMVIIIRDNGTGIRKDQLSDIRHDIEGDLVDVTDDDVTFANINRRIKLYYGDDYGIKVESSRLGTIVRLYLPVHSPEA